MSLPDLPFNPAHCLINGKWQAPLDGQTLALIDPSDGSELTQIARGQSRDINTAIEAAQNALNGEWGNKTALERGRILTRIGQLVLEHVDLLAELEARDVGKPLTQARADAIALAPLTDQITYLEEGDRAVVTRAGAVISDVHGTVVHRQVQQIQIEATRVDKAGHKHFMAKEIEEQPATLKNCINEYVDKINNDINIYNFPWNISDISSITLIGCGTAYHSCLMAKYWFEENTSLEVAVDIASEFRYRKNRFKKDNLYIFVSQSGETADTYAALDLCNQNNMKTCSIVNVVESSIARDSNFVLPIHCGPEIGVASTKAFMGQMLVLYILVLKLGRLREDFDKETYLDKIKELKKLPKLVEDTLLTENKIQAVSGSFTDAKGSMFLGRGFSYPIALEGALKLKELAYVHAEGYPAGEMKHGPLALIEDGMPVVVLAPRDNYYKKTISNMQEVIARGAKVLLITNKSKDEVFSENIWETILVESANDDLLPFLLTVPLQKLAYYSALLKGYDIDKPRNLAKSVTVE